jgi:hypothetical protein
LLALAEYLDVELADDEDVDAGAAAEEASTGVSAQTRETAPKLSRYF